MHVRPRKFCHPHLLQRGVRSLTWKSPSEKRLDRQAACRMCCAFLTTRYELDLATKTCPTMYPLCLPLNSRFFSNLTLANADWRRARRAHWLQSKLQLLAVGMLQGRRARHAQLCACPNRKTLFVHGNGESTCVASQNGRSVMVLCRIGGRVLAGWRVDEFQLVSRSGNSLFAVQAVQGSRRSCRQPVHASSSVPGHDAGHGQPSQLARPARERSHTVWWRKGRGRQQY